MRKFEYIAIGGEYGFADASLIGKRLLSVQKSGIGYSKIVTTTPTEKEVQYNSSAGSIYFLDVCAPGMDIVVLFEDSVALCMPVTIPSFTLPGTYASFPYNASFFVGGTPGYSISSISGAPWILVSPVSGQVVFSGTPAIGDVGGNAISFTLSNACGSVDFSGTIEVTLMDTNFATTTIISGDRLTEIEVANLTGTPGNVVTIECDNYINSNGGQIKVNGNIVTLGYSFTVNIGSDGKGSFNCEIDGVANPGTGMLGHFKIDSVTIGSIGLSDKYQIDKAFS